MKKNKIRVCAILFIICVALSSQLNGHAQNAISEAEVEFTAGMGPTYPVHPEDPSVEGNEDPVSGSLAIVSVSSFEFGTTSITTTGQSLNIVTAMPNIQVVDLRGTGTGWQVSATVSRFTDGDNDTLPGATIHIIDGRPNSVSTSLAPEQKQNTLLTTDGNPVLAITAGSGAGMGLWVMRWYPENTGQYIKLEIPAGAETIGSHSATINWILENTP